MSDVIRLGDGELGFREQALDRLLAARRKRLRERALRDAACLTALGAFAATRLAENGRSE